MHSIRFSVLQATVALMIVTTTLFAATQWAAAMLGNQPALGDPWLHVLGLNVYAPWKLFVWWLAFDTQAPDVFVRAGAVAVFGGLMSGAVSIRGAAWRASLNKQPDDLRLGPMGGSPRCARRRDLRRKRHRARRAPALADVGRDPATPSR
jgi:type IV secretory pathway TraG/TraD family ATPase VirD4